MFVYAEGDTAASTSGRGASGKGQGSSGRGRGKKRSAADSEGNDGGKPARRKRATKKELAALAEVACQALDQTSSAMYLPGPASVIVGCHSWEDMESRLSSGGESWPSWPAVIDFISSRSCACLLLVCMALLYQAALRETIPQTIMIYS